MCGSANYWMPPALGIQRIDRETALARSDRGEGYRARGSKRLVKSYQSWCATRCDRWQRLASETVCRCCRSRGRALSVKTEPISRGTGSSNPLPSGGESVANSVFAKAGPRASFRRRHKRAGRIELRDEQLYSTRGTEQRAAF
jgi:hypothetical protein